MKNLLTHLILFIATIVTTTYAGFYLFGTLQEALYYSLSLIVILGAHEMGHYIFGRRYGVCISPPYFIPVPSFSYFPTLGTFGAFIKVHSPVKGKKALFDIGIAGPFAGIIPAVIFSSIGIKLSTFAVGVPEGVESTIKLGVPPLYELLQHLFLAIPGDGDVVYATYWHPFAFSGWLGMLLTALNLLPVGQLDGGHILYTLVSRKWHRRISWSIVLILIFLGIGTKPIFDVAGWLREDSSLSPIVRPYVFGGWSGWLVWALILTFISRRQPSILVDEAPIDYIRKFVALVAFALLVLCFTPFPISL